MQEYVPASQWVIYFSHTFPSIILSWIVRKITLNVFTCYLTLKKYSDYLRIAHSGLPRWRSGWESACQCRGRRFVPWSGKIPHAAERLGPWAMAAEPARPEPVLRNGRGHNSERPTYRKEKPPKKTKKEFKFTQVREMNILITSEC